MGIDMKRARAVLERVNNFLGILIREQLVKEAPFLDEGELEDESCLADDVWEVLNSAPRQCDVGTPEEQSERFRAFCRKGTLPQFAESAYCAYECACRASADCKFEWAQTPYEAGAAK